jgi:hypothetical protein
MTEATITTPIVDLLSMTEVQTLALHALLMKQGVDDPLKFVKENDVSYVAAIRANIGMAVTITSITPKEVSGNER